MGPFLAAWLIGEGIIVYRSVKQQKAPPGPGQLLLSSGLFVMLGLLAESRSARPLAITLAYGFDIAALMNLWGTGGPKAGSAVGKWPPAQAPQDVIIPSAANTIANSGSSTTPSIKGPVPV